MQEKAAFTLATGSPPPVMLVVICPSTSLYSIHLSAGAVHPTALAVFCSLPPSPPTWQELSEYLLPAPRSVLTTPMRTLGSLLPSLVDLSASMSLGKFFTRFVCSSFMEPELSMTNSRSTSLSR